MHVGVSGLNVSVEFDDVAEGAPLPDYAEQYAEAKRQVVEALQANPRIKVVSVTETSVVYEA